LAVQAIPNGPALPDGWVPPDPVGAALGQVDDPYANETGILDEDGMPVAPPVDQPQELVRPDPKRVDPKLVDPKRPEASRTDDALFY